MWLSLTTRPPPSQARSTWIPLWSGWINHYLFLVYFPLLKVAVSSLYSHLAPWPTGDGKGNNRLYFGKDISSDNGSAKFVLLIYKKEVVCWWQRQTMTNCWCSYVSRLNAAMARNATGIADWTPLAALMCVLCHILVLQTCSRRNSDAGNVCVCLGR